MSARVDVSTRWLRGVAANAVLVGLIVIAIGADWAVGWR